MNPTWKAPLLAVALSLLLAACSSSNNSTLDPAPVDPDPVDPDPVGPVACDVSGLEGETVLLTFFNDGNAIAFATGGLDETRTVTLAEVADDEVVAVQVTGLGTNEFVIGADFNPANDELMAVSNLGNFYRAPMTGTCGNEDEPGTNALALTPLLGTDGTTPVSTPASDRISISFNPTVNAFRVLKGDSTNLRFVLNADGTGLRALEVEGAPTLSSNPVIDSALMYDAGDANAGENVFAVDLAYTNQILDEAGARPTATEVFVIDTPTDKLNFAQLGGAAASEGNPNLGRLVTIIEDESDVDFFFVDIDPERGNLAVGLDGGESCALVFDFTFAAFKADEDDFADRGELFCNNNQALLGVTEGSEPSAFTVVPKAAIENLEFAAEED